MFFIEFLTRPITSKRLEKKGQSLYIMGKIFSLCGLIGFCMFVLSIIGALIVNGGNGVLGLLEFALEGFEFMYVILPVSYLGILLGVIGIPMYFNGLFIFSLGRIAHNTEKE